MAASVLDKPGIHKILGAEVNVSVFMPPATKEDLVKQFEHNKIMLYYMPKNSNIGDEMLNLYVQNRLKLQEDECTIAVVDNRVLVTFSSEYTTDGE